MDLYKSDIFLATIHSLQILLLVPSPGFLFFLPFVFLPSINIRYTNVNQYPFLRGLNAHYHVMSEEDYKSTL